MDDRSRVWCFPQCGEYQIAAAKLSCTLRYKWEVDFVGVIHVLVAAAFSEDISVLALGHVSNGECLKMLLK